MRKNEVEVHSLKGEFLSHDEDLSEKGRSLPLRFRYWRNWIIMPTPLKTVAIFPSVDPKDIKRLKDKFLADSNTLNLDKLVRAAPSTLRDGDVSEKVSKLLYKTNIRLPKIESKRGAANPVKLRDKTIKKDIEHFKDMVDKYLQGETAWDICKWKPDRSKDSDRAKIWSNYIKAARFIIKALEGSEDPRTASREAWEAVFLIFEIMSSQVGAVGGASACNITFKGHSVLLRRVEVLQKNVIIIPI